MFKGNLAVLKSVFIIGAAVTLGIGLIFYFDTMFLGILFAGFILYIRRRHEKKVVAIFLVAIILRLIFSLLHVSAGYKAGSGSDLVGDSVGYSGGGAYVAEVLTNKKVNGLLIADELANLIRFRETYKGSFPRYEAWRVGGYTYYLGLIYAFFGFSPVAVKLINSLLFIITAYIIYRYLLKYFGQRSAFYFLAFFLFLPSLFIWSVSGVKDQLIYSLFIAGIFSFWYLIESGKIWGIILTEGIILNLPLLFIVSGAYPLFRKDRNMFRRFILSAISIFSVKIGLISIRPLNYSIFFGTVHLMAILYIILYIYRLRLFKIGIVLLIVFLTVALPVKRIMSGVYRRFTYQSITKSRTSQFDAVTKYQIYPERYNYDEPMRRVGITRFNPPSIPEFIIMAAKGMGYALFSPLPWMARSWFELLASFEGQLMLITFLWVLNGIFLSCRKAEYFTLSLPVIVPFIIFLVVLAFFEGNVGTLFRHRSMLLPFYGILFAIGISNNRAKLQ